MHPFHLSQVIYFGIIILVIAALFIFEKLSKRSLPKATIIVYSLTSLLLVSIVVSIYFLMLHDYSLLFPANYFQPHNYLFAVFALLILVNIYSKQGSDISAFNQKNKLLLCCSLIMLVLLMVVPTSEKIADYYHRSQASEMLGMDDEMLDTAITHDVSSCRENPEYRKTYQIFDCEIEGSRVYYMYAKNTTSETKHIVVHLTLFDRNDEAVDSFSSKEITLDPNETDKVIFDRDVSKQPDWMQHSFFSSKEFISYEYEIEDTTHE